MDLIMAYVRKTKDEFQLLANYGFGHGWECICVGESRKEIRQRLREYRVNEGGHYRVICKRVKIGE